MSNRFNNRFITPARRNGVHSKKKDGISIIILSAGYAYRMKSYGAKSLLKLPDGTSVLERILESVYLHFPSADVILTVGFQADKVIKNRPQGVRIVENQLYEQTNLIEEARLGINNAAYENTLIIDGGLIFNHETLAGIDKHGSSIIVDDADQIGFDEVGVTVVEEEATIMAYGLPSKWCHIAYLSGKEFKLFRQFCANREKNKCFMFEGLNSVLSKGGKLRVIQPPKMEIKKIENSKDLGINESNDSE